MDKNDIEWFIEIINIFIDFKISLALFFCNKYLFDL